MKKRLFVDMDGTLTEWRFVVRIEQLYEKGYFRTLRPQEAVVAAIRRMAKDEETEVFILSAVLSDSRYARSEKQQWLREHLPEIPTTNVLFPPCGTCKTEFVPGGVRPEDVLFDDYTKNLKEWGGVGVKCLNGLNAGHGSWKGNRLSAFASPRDLAEDLSDIVHEGALIRHPVPTPRDPRKILCLASSGRTLEVRNGCGEMLFCGDLHTMQQQRSVIETLLHEAHLLVCWEWMQCLLPLQAAGVEVASRPVCEIARLPEGLSFRPGTPVRDTQRLLRYFWEFNYPAAPKNFVPEGKIEIIEEASEPELGM